MGVNYYDGQGFLVNKGKITSAKQLKGATVCVQSGTTTEKNLTDFSRANKLDIKPVVFEKLEATNAAYFAGRCVAYTTDASGLASIRNKEAKDPKEHVILPELISKEPLGPSVRRGDDEFFTIAKWVVFALIEAEDYGVTQANVDAMSKTTDNPAIGRLLGSTEDTGKLLGLDKSWATHAIKAVGNYGEIFERNVGPKSPLGVPRGLNNLWSNGGIMYAPPVRLCGAEAPKGRSAQRPAPFACNRTTDRPAAPATSGRLPWRFRQAPLPNSPGRGAAVPHAACCTRSSRSA